MTNLVQRVQRESRTYAAAVLLNLALVNTVLTPPRRPVSAQTRIVTSAQRFRATETIALGDGGAAILSTHYDPELSQPAIGVN